MWEISPGIMLAYNVAADRYEVSNNLVAYALSDPARFSKQEFELYVEKLFNLPPNSVSIPNGVISHGQYRQANQAFYGHPTTFTNPSPQRAHKASQAAQFAIQTGRNPANFLAQQGFSPSEVMDTLDVIIQAWTLRNLKTQRACLVLSIPTLSAPWPVTALQTSSIVAGEVLGWRAWDIGQQTDRWIIKSVTADKVWEPRETVDGDVAGGYGIHAYKSPLGPTLDGYANEFSLSAWVLGRVALWGDVIEHERGWRGQFARPFSFDHFHRVSERTEQELRAKYLALDDFAVSPESET